ncbi:MAG: AAA-like domain-containing protein [Prochloraceae cyanobacterium]
MTTIKKINDILEEAQQDSQILKMVDYLKEMSETIGKELNNTHIETYIILCVDSSVTYNVIGEALDKSEDTIRFAAKDIFKILNQILKTKGQIGKRNFRMIGVPAIKAYHSKKDNSPIPQNNNLKVKNTDVVVLPKIKQQQPPKGALAGNSPFYIKREIEERDAKKEIDTPGGLLKIEGDNGIGKTSFLKQMLNYSEQQSYHSVYLDLHLVDREILTNLENFLKWLSANVALKLNIPDRIEEEWRNFIGAKSSCTNYFESYLLEQIKDPIVLAIDKIDYIIENKDIAIDFFGLLRGWYDNTEPHWKKLRIVLIYKENTLSLKQKQSPFNVGTTIRLKYFGKQEVKELAEKYSLKWNVRELNNILEVVGGHPFQVHNFIYNFVEQDKSLVTFLREYSQKK